MMKKLRNKTLTTIAMVLILTSSISLLIVNAEEDLNLYTWIIAAPTSVGVNQPVFVGFGFTMPTRGLGYQMYDGWMITITEPDGSEIEMGPYTCDSTGGTGTQITPNKVGTWKIQAHYPGGYADFSATEMNVSVAAATTDEIEITVQEEKITGHEVYPPPTEYWQFPIYGENYEWNAIGGNWLLPGYDTSRHIMGAKSGPYNPYTTMPEAGHILWTKPQQFGGVIGGAYGEESYYTGASYRPSLQPPVVINGRLYYNVMEPPRNGWYCVDIYTGETIWYKTGTYPDGNGGFVEGRNAQLTLGQILCQDTVNWKGGIPYLWSTGASTWAVWDAWSGDLQYTIVNAPSTQTAYMRDFSFVADPNGALIAYRFDRNTGTITMWNSSLLIDKEVSSQLRGIGRERPKYNLDWNAGIQWTATVPDVTNKYLITTWDTNDLSVLIATNQSRGTPGVSGAFEDIAISGEDGSVLWRKVRDEGIWEAHVCGYMMSMEHDVYTIYRKETRQVYAYRVSNGEELWVSEPRSSGWGTYLTAFAIVYDKVFTAAYDGMIYAHDVKTGDLVWEWGPIDASMITPYGVYPLYDGLTFADNKVIATHGEHSADSPLYRGEGMYVIDADSGTTLWNISGWYERPVVANTLIVAPNCYDGRLYCFGKGPSETTVSIQNDVITQGNSVMIKGTVMDISAGTSQDEQAARFPDGVPAVADKCMSEWMDYVYMQKPRPAVSGVTVKLEAVDSNNEYHNLGTTTSDSYGNYGFTFKPETEGQYMIIATFEGSGAYYGSTETTYLTVGPAVSTDNGNGSTDNGNGTTPIITTEAAIILAIAIIVAIGIVAFLALRKQK